MFLIADLSVLAQLFRHMSLELLGDKIYPMDNSFFGPRRRWLGSLEVYSRYADVGLYGVEDMENISLRNDGVKQHDKRDESALWVCF